eukprot:scaffold65527_cov44-Phaeocystis_antarctica.AAC.3
MGPAKRTWSSSRCEACSEATEVLVRQPGTFRPLAVVLQWQRQSQLYILNVMAYASPSPSFQHPHPTSSDAPPHHGAPRPDPRRLGRHRAARAAERQRVGSLLCRAYASMCIAPPPPRVGT